MSQILESIAEALIDGDDDVVRENVKIALDEGISAAEILNDGLLSGMDEVGALFKEGEMFVPEVLVAAKAMQAGVELLKPLLVESGTKPLARILTATVAGDLYAIGYISLGSLNDTVKAIQIDGVDATAANVENGTYPVSRPFNIAYKEGSLSEVAQDFVNYIMSADGQAVIEEEGYIPVSDAEAYTASGLTGEVVLHGSSSVTPVMEKLAESYMALNEGVTVTVQQSDSSTGMTDAIEGTCDIGMASRAVKDEELSQGLTSTTIAMDGIAVIVNNDSPVTGLTTEQVRDIFTGALTVWSDVISE